MNNNLTPAATVLVLRDSEEGMEVLMVKRSKKPPFENLYAVSYTHLTLPTIA